MQPIWTSEGPGDVFIECLRSGLLHCPSETLVASQPKGPLVQALVWDKMSTCCVIGWLALQSVGMEETGLVNVGMEAEDAETEPRESPGPSVGKAIQQRVIDAFSFRCT